MAQLTIPPVTIPAGQQVFGPFAIVGGWSNLDLTLDIVNVTSLEFLVELSNDGGVNYHTIAQDSAGPPVVSPFTGLLIPYRYVTHWSPALAAGLVKLTLTNAVAFPTSGGALAVT